MPSHNPRLGRIGSQKKGGWMDELMSASKSVEKLHTWEWNIPAHMKYFLHHQKQILQTIVDQVFQWNLLVVVRPSKCSRITLLADSMLPSMLLRLSFIWKKQKQSIKFLPKNMCCVKLKPSQATGLSGCGFRPVRTAVSHTWRKFFLFSCPTALTFSLVFPSWSTRSANMLKKKQDQMKFSTGFFFPVKKITCIQGFKQIRHQCIEVCHISEFNIQFLLISDSKEILQKIQ